MASETVVPRHVRLHPLAMRRGSDGWVIGRVETGEFVTVPDIGRRAVELLRADGDVAAARRRLSDELGDDVDLESFVGTLVDLGFVTEVDGRWLDTPPPPRATLAWLEPRHVHWLLHPAVAVASGLAMLAGLIALIAHPELMPGYRAVVWSSHGSIVIAANAVIGWTIVGAHEFAHLATARAAGAPARMSLGTRLQFLVAQTDVSGVWAAPRRTRITVYLAGMALNLLVAAAGVLALAAWQPHGLARDLTSVTILLSLLSVPYQFMVFVRTDVYFVLQDVIGCANLYADGIAYLRYLARRAVRRTPAVAIDPTRALPERERMAVRVYCLLLTLGSVVCLAIAAAVTVPAGITLFAHAVESIAAADRGWPLADGITVIVAGGIVQALWLRAWWRRHGHQVRRFVRERHVRGDRSAEGR